MSDISHRPVVLPESRIQSGFGAEAALVIGRWVGAAPEGRMELLDHCIKWAQFEGLWDKLFGWWVVNFTEQAAAINLKNPTGLVITKHGAASYTNDQFWEGDGVTGYFNTHWNVGTGGWTITDAHLGLGIGSERLGAANKYIVGLLAGSGADVKLRFNPAAADLSGPDAPFKANAIGRFGTTVDDGIDGHHTMKADWMLERTALSERKVWRNHLLIDTAVGAMVSWPSLDLLLFRDSNFYGDGKLQWVTVGVTLTEAEWGALRQINRFWLQEIGGLQP